MIQGFDTCLLEIKAGLLRGWVKAVFFSHNRIEKLHSLFLPQNALAKVKVSKYIKIFTNTFTRTGRTKPVCARTK